MKAVRSRIFAFLMIGVVLTFNTGMGLVEHTCLMSGKKSVSTEHRKGCCSKKSTQAATGQNETSIQADNCCEVEAYYIQVDFVSLQEKLSKFFANLYFTAAERVVNLFHALVSKNEAACSYTNSSPPQTGRVLLTKHCTLIV